MHWTLTRKVTAGAFIYLALIVTLAVAIVQNTRANHNLFTYLHTLLEETNLAGSYNTDMQQFLTEVVMHIHESDPDAYEEASATLDQLDETAAALDSLNATVVHLSGTGEDSAAHREEWSALVDTAGQLFADIGDKDNINPTAAADLGEAVEELEEDRERLAAAVAEHIDQEWIEAESQVATYNQITYGSVGGAIAGILLLTMLGIWLLERQVVRPVRQLAQAARAVASGQLDQTVAQTSRDEIGILQRSFNEMVATLQQQTSELEAQVEQVTRARDEAEAARKAAEAARDEAEAAHTRMAEQLTIIEAQQHTIQELSVPVLPLSLHTLVVPLVGTIDTSRAQHVMERLLDGITSHKARLAILDITGVEVVDTQVANALIRAAQAARLLGAQVVLTGIRPQIAHTLVQLGIDLRDIVTHSSLQSGITYALNGHGSNGRNGSNGVR